MKRIVDPNKRLSQAVAYFWNTRDRQSNRQASVGKADKGARGAVTGGQQMNGFIQIIREIVITSGLPSSSVHTTTKLELPGYFRAEKKWDLVIIDRGTLIAIIEFKSQVGPSFGNNFNNRAEESIGSSQDIWTAYREGAFSTSQRPWLGYFMLLEDCPKSNSSVSLRQPHFPVFPEFSNTSYAGRYQLLLTRLIRERLYDAGCFIMSPRDAGRKGKFNEPNVDLRFETFAASLVGRLAGLLKQK